MNKWTVIIIGVLMVVGVVHYFESIGAEIEEEPGFSENYKYLYGFITSAWGGDERENVTVRLEDGAGNYIDHHIYDPNLEIVQPDSKTYNYLGYYVAYKVVTVDGRYHYRDVILVSDNPSWFEG